MAKFTLKLTAYLSFILYRRVGLKKLIELIGNIYYIILYIWTLCNYLAYYCDICIILYFDFSGAFLIRLAIFLFFAGLFLSFLLLFFLAFFFFPRGGFLSWGLLFIMHTEALFYFHYPCWAGGCQHAFAFFVGLFFCGNAFLAYRFRFLLLRQAHSGRRF